MRNSFEASDATNVDHKPKAAVDTVPSSEGGDFAKPVSLANGGLKKMVLKDNFGVCGDAGMKATAKAKHSVESRNEEGDCVVKVESAGDECSTEEHEEEEDVERDEVDGKAESEAKELLADESHDAETKKNNKGCDNMKQKQDKESIYRHPRSSRLHFAKGFMYLSLAPQMMMQKLSTWRMEFAQLSCWQGLC
ncbi:hypothetical protein EZV62_016825 [Acer yangbiense]|uniref:Uncharacterized protein n=1 Tax=Acer yangbiense TaxID=1000413 RepID=A0A5C7HRT0_9ROSI|nr:hypothetical protein EZV62_016825 [Acer yangbiense]